MLQLFDDELLEFNSSQIAAVTLILSINIVNMYELIESLMLGEINEHTPFAQQHNFFNLVCQQSKLQLDSNGLPMEQSFELNLDIWNNARISGITGYTLEMLKPCLLSMIEFMKQNLQPDRLKYFCTDQIKFIQNNL